MKESSLLLLFSVGFISLFFTNILVFKCCLYVAGCSIRDFSTSKMPNFRHLVKQYKRNELTDPKIINYLRWYLITFRVFYITWFIALLLLTLSNI